MTYEAPLLTLLNAPTLAAYTAAGLWGNETIYQLAARHARAIAGCVRGARPLSPADLCRAGRGRRPAGGASCRKRRPPPGQRVAVWLPSRVETAIALLACSRNGYVCCPSLHRDHRLAEVVALVDRMRAAALIAQPGYGADADRHDIFDRTGRPRFPALRLAGRPGRRGAVRRPRRPDASRSPPSDDANQVMYLPFTSGTTGAPKGVLHSDNTLLATARMMARDWRLDGAVLYTLSPLSHNLGLGALITALAGGGELVVHDLPRGAACSIGWRRPAPNSCSACRRMRSTCWRSCAPATPRRLGTVRGFRISGAAAPPSVIAELMRYGVVPQSGYGMTETCSHQYTLPRRSARPHRRDQRPRLRRLRNPHLAPGRPGHRGSARRNRRDRRPRRQPDARLFRRPAGDRGGVQRRRAGS